MFYSRTDKINIEDQKVSLAVKVIPNINSLVEAVTKQLGGRLFYIGAGAGGRLG